MQSFMTVFIWNFMKSKNNFKTIKQSIQQKSCWPNLRKYFFVLSIRTPRSRIFILRLTNIYMQPRVKHFCCWQHFHDHYITYILYYEQRCCSLRYQSHILIEPWRLRQSIDCGRPRVLGANYVGILRSYLWYDCIFMIAISRFSILCSKLRSVATDKVVVLCGSVARRYEWIFVRKHNQTYVSFIIF